MPIEPDCQDAGRVAMETPASDLGIAELPGSRLL